MKKTTNPTDPRVKINQTMNLGKALWMYPEQWGVKPSGKKKCWPKLEQNLAEPFEEAINKAITEVVEANGGDWPTSTQMNACLIRARNTLVNRFFTIINEKFEGFGQLVETATREEAEEEIFVEVFGDQTEGFLAEWLRPSCRHKLLPKRTQ